MYDAAAMKDELDGAVRTAKEKVRAKFCEAFRSLYPNGHVPTTFAAGGPKIRTTAVTTASDLDRVTAGPGLYVVFTDHPVENNDCGLWHGKLQAIYRGECSMVRERLLSHLFYRQYRSGHSIKADKYESNPKNQGRQFYKTIWPHCLKLSVGGPSGVNIDQAPYSAHRWAVVVHHMAGSSQQVRQLAELAFDEVFGHPAASREV